MEYIFNAFKVTNEEYAELEDLFGDLAQYAAWQLIKKNVRNNHTHEQEDIVQELRWSLIKAASYYKRQVYLEESIRSVKHCCKANKVASKKIAELEDLWLNRTRHGANRQKFGPAQEKILEKLLTRFVPAIYRPSKEQCLIIDTKFKTYCKAIVWNKTRELGKKISKEKGLRSGLVSLSNFDYLANE